MARENALWRWCAPRSSDADIAGATDASYTLADSDEGSAIKVRVTFTDDAGHAETLTSAATGAMALPLPPLTAAFHEVPARHDGPSAALWCRGASSRFDGREGSLTIEGEVTSATLGTDWTSGPWFAGAMVSHSMGDGSYSGDGAGKVGSTLTGVYPYAAFDATERVRLWAAAGYGEGTFTLIPKRPGTGEYASAMKTDMSLGMGAFGAQATGGADALLGRETLSDLAADDDGMRSRRFDVRLGYGIAPLGERFTATPELGFGMSGTVRDYRLGWRLASTGAGSGSFELRLDATRTEPTNGDADPEHGVQLGFTARL